MPQFPDPLIPVPVSLLFILRNAATAAAAQAKANADDAIDRLRVLPVSDPSADLFIEIAAFRTAQRDYEDAERQANQLLDSD